MKDKKRLAIVVLISAVGMMVIVLATRIGASYASPPPPPPESQYPVVDAGIEPGVQSRQAYTLTRIQTITLEPLVRPITDRPDMRSDLMTGTYPVRVQDIYYNWPGTPGYYIRVFTESEDILVSTPANPSLPYGAVDAAGYKYYPGGQPWVSVSYRRRVITTSAPYARQFGGMISVATNIGSPSGQLFYDPITTTVIYARQFPSQAPSDYWGISHSMPHVVSRDPEPVEETEESVRWVATTNNFIGNVVLSDTIFGSDLTVTHFSVYPLTPTLGGRVYSTVTLQNVGPMTAWRWFRAELYLKPEKDLPPKDALDHSWGQVIYYGDAVFHKPGTLFDWKVEQLGPSQSITLITVITVARASGSGKLKAYAQADTGEVTEQFQYAWFGSNPEGYCYRPGGCNVNSRPPAEYNVSTLKNESGNDQIVFIPEVYMFEASPAFLPWKAPAGTKAIYYLKVENVGNVTDTYMITPTSSRPTWTVTWPKTVGPVRYEVPGVPTATIKTFTVSVLVPAGTPENTSSWTTLTLVSKGDPTVSNTIRLQTIAGYYRYYLPIVKKNSK